jgi:hypothetical protein
LDQGVAGGVLSGACDTGDFPEGFLLFFGELVGSGLLTPHTAKVLSQVTQGGIKFFDSPLFERYDFLVVRAVIFEVADKTFEVVDINIGIRNDKSEKDVSNQRNSQNDYC